jgi:hypothetical protein
MVWAGADRSGRFVDGAVHIDIDSSVVTMLHAVRGFFRFAQQPIVRAIEKRFAATASCTCLRRVTASCFAANSASCRLNGTVGMRREART